MTKHKLYLRKLENKHYNHSGSIYIDSKTTTERSHGFSNQWLNISHICKKLENRLNKQLTAQTNEQCRRTTTPAQARTLPPPPPPNQARATQDQPRGQPPYYTSTSASASGYMQIIGKIEKIRTKNRGKLIERVNI